jgi:hypothetical protein
MHKKLSSALVLSAALVCLLGSPGFMAAQGNTWVGVNLEQMVNAARIRLGELRLNAAFELTNAGYDSDVYYGYLEEAAPDYTFSAGLPVQVLLPLSKKVVLDVSDTPQYLFYLDTERERAWNNSFQGLIHFALDEIYLQAGLESANVRRRLSPELDVNVREKRNGLNGLALWQLSRMTSLALIYGGTEYSYTDAEFLGENISERLSRREEFFDFVTYVQPGPRTRIFVDGQFGTYKFTATEAANRDAKSYAFFGGVEFIPRTGEVLQRMGIRGSARLGYTRLDIDESGVPGGSGITGEADISFEFLKKTTGRLSLTRAFQFSIYSGASFYLTTRYGAGIARRLSRRASLNYGFSYVNNDYPRASGFDGVNNRFLNHSISLGLRLARHLDVTLLGTLSQRTRYATDPVRNRSFLGMSLTYGYSRVGMSAPVGGLSR